MKYSRITGTGSALPARCVSNDELARELATRGIETSHDWIVERTGIRQRYVASADESTSGLAVLAARRAMLVQHTTVSFPFSVEEIVAMGADIDPRKAACTLLNTAIDHGAKLYAPVNVAEVDPRKTNVIATTSSGHSIRAKHLVFATGYEFPKRVPQRGHRIVSTWAIATVSQKRRLWPGEPMIWQSADPYLYLRTTPDGRVICGGED